MAISIISIFYLILIISFSLAYDKIKPFASSNSRPVNTFTIVIPFRNEEEHLPELLESISKLKYDPSLFEILLIDDDSEDHSVKIIDSFISELNLEQSKISIKIIVNNRASNSPKKDAITLAILHAQYDWIITTDADCVLPEHWLNSFNAFIQENATNFISGPVRYSNNNSLLNSFQVLDFLSLQTATVSGFALHQPFLCNGANLAYRKQFFIDVNGFEGNNNISSGDDIFLLEKALKQMPKSVHFLKSKDAIVVTKPEQTIKSLIQQRIRWAAKTSSYSNLFGKFVGLIVLLMNVALIISFVLSCIGEFQFRHLLVVFFLKILVDFWCIHKSASFYNQPKHVFPYLISSLIYPIFTVYIAFYSSFFGYTWKHRSFRK